VGITAAGALLPTIAVDPLAPRHVEPYAGMTQSALHAR
jgi:hypothetical protein